MPGIDLTLVENGAPYIYRIGVSGPPTTLSILQSSPHVQTTVAGTFNAFTLSFVPQPDYYGDGGDVIVELTTDFGAGPVNQIDDFHFDITHVPQPPSNITISNNVVNDHTPGAFVGTLNAIEPDGAPATFNFQIESDPSGLFEVQGFDVFLKPGAATDFDIKSSYNLVFRATNNSGLSFDKTLTINVKDFNDPQVRNDFNADGDSDLLLQNTNGTPQIWLMNGTSVVNKTTLPAQPASWKVIGSGDFNGDGHADIIWQNSDGTPRIWEMNGTSIVTAATLPAVPPSWHVIATGDFNHDGLADILWQNTDGTSAIWEMNGTSIVKAATLPAVPPSWHAIGSGDFNGDGNADILWQNTDGTPGIWEMNGTAIVKAATLPAVPPSWHAIGTGDFNADGNADILWQNSDGTPGIWEMNGTSIVKAATLPAVPPSWHAIGTSAVHGDGNADVLWQNSDGTVAVWEMNGTSLVSPVVVGNPGAAWQLKNDGPIPADQRGTRTSSGTMHQSAPDMVSTGELVADATSLGQPTAPGAGQFAPGGAISLGAASSIGLLDPSTRNNQHPMLGVT